MLNTDRHLRAFIQVSQAIEKSMQSTDAEVERIVGDTVIVALMRLRELSGQKIPYAAVERVWQEVCARKPTTDASTMELQARERIKRREQQESFDAINQAIALAKQSLLQIGNTNSATE